MVVPELFSDDEYPKFLGLARSVLWRLPWDIQEEIAQKVYVKLRHVYHDRVEKLVAQLGEEIQTARQEIGGTAYAAVALRNEGTEYGRRLARTSETTLEDVEDTKAASTRPAVETERVPLVYIEHRIRMVFDDERSTPNELLAYGRQELLGEMPAATAARIAPLTMAEAAREFVQEYSQTSRVPEWRLNELFSRLLNLEGTPAGNRPVDELLGLAATVQYWVDDIRERCGMQETFSAEEFQDALHDFPNSCVAYLLHVWLGVAAEEIVRRGKTLTLGDAAEYFMEEYEKKSGLSFDQILSTLGGGLDCGRNAKGLLVRSDKAARICEHWSFAVRRRLLARRHHHEKTGLKAIFEQGGPPWETICFVETLILHKRPDDLMREHGSSSLMTIVKTQVEGGRYADTWGKKTAPPEPGRRAKRQNDRPNDNQVRVWFEPLRKQLLQDGAVSLGELVKRDPNYAGAGAEVIARWRSSVLQRIRPHFGYDQPDTLLMAKRVGLLEGRD